MLAWGYRIKILLRCDFFRYDALRLSVYTPKASFRNFASSREQEKYLCEIGHFACNLAALF
jgi:hypothetical protein